jgi:hypothetical protein
VSDEFWWVLLAAQTKVFNSVYKTINLSGYTIDIEKKYDVSVYLVEGMEELVTCLVSLW